MLNLEFSLRWPCWELTQGSTYCLELQRDPWCIKIFCFWVSIFFFFSLKEKLCCFRRIIICRIYLVCQHSQTLSKCSCLAGGLNRWCPHSALYFLASIVCKFREQWDDQGLLRFFKNEKEMLLNKNNIEVCLNLSRTKN